MNKYKILVLTDHTNHSSENSLYPLLAAMRLHPGCETIEVASKGIHQNLSFFQGNDSEGLWSSRVQEDFGFFEDGRSFSIKLQNTQLVNFDIILLRLPPTMPSFFWKFLSEKYPDLNFINDPKGILEAGNKKFLLNFQSVCPPMQLCNSIEDIVAFKNQFPIVLKPLQGYGGAGLLKIDGDSVWDGQKIISFESFSNTISGKEISFLGVKYLKNVSKGDKRIVVINGEIIGAALRLPPPGSWLANIAQGGICIDTEVDENEIEIVKNVHPVLKKMGIFMYGIDTLVNDDGKRVLSEINATSIGGLHKIGKGDGVKTIESVSNKIWDHINKIKNGRTA